MKKEAFNGRKDRASDILADKLRRQIASGELKANDFLLPELRLAEEQGVSSRVVRECLSALEAEGLIARQQGRGTFVLPQKQENPIPKLKNIAVIFLQRMQDAATWIWSALAKYPVITPMQLLRTPSPSIDFKMASISVAGNFTPDGLPRPG